MTDMKRVDSEKQAAPVNSATPGVTTQPAPAAGTSRSSNKRLQQTQAQVDEVVDIMKVNVEKVLERDSKLSELDTRADALQDGARQFENSAHRLKRKYWWQNMKMWLILIAVIIVIIIIIIVAIVTSLPDKGTSGGGSSGATTTTEHS